MSANDLLLNIFCSFFIREALRIALIRSKMVILLIPYLFGEQAAYYTCDLFHDDQPTPIKLRQPKKFVSIPYSLEMNDTIAYVVNKIEPRRYGQQIRRCFDRLYAEGEQSGTVMCIPTHNYQVSCPHRLRAFEEALEYITGHSDVWVATGKEIADYVIEHYYDDLNAEISRVNTIGTQHV